MKISSLGVNVVPKREKGKGGSVREEIFPKYRDESIAALQESLREAQGRFNMTSGDFAPEAEAYGAPNWRVVAGNTDKGETVEVFWKVGRRSKVALFEDDNGNYVSTIRVSQGDVENVVQQMLATISSDGFQNTKEGALFHEAAIKAAMPPVNRDSFRYSREHDMYVKK